MEEGPTRTNNKVVFLCYPCSTACTPRLLASVCVPEASFPGRKFGSPQFLTDNRPPTNHTLHYGLISTWIKKCKMSAKANLSVSHQTSNWISDLNFLQFLRFRCSRVCSKCIGSTIIIWYPFWTLIIISWFREKYRKLKLPIQASLPSFNPVIS